MMIRTLSARAVAAAVVSVAVLAVTGCGSSSTSSTASTAAATVTQASSATASTTSSAAGASSTGYAAAQRIVQSMSGQATDLPTAPLKTKPKNATVAVIDCGLPPCKVQEDAWKAEAPRLGMTVKVVAGGTTATALNSALDQVLAMKPSGVEIPGIPTAFFQSYIPRLKAAGTKILTVFTNDDPKIAPWNVAGNSYQEGIGVKQAALAAVLAGGKGHELLVNASSIAGQTAQAHVIANALPKFGDFKVTWLSVNPADIGTGIANQVAGAVERDPSINVIQFTGGDFVQGVSQALQTGGVRNQVKIVATGGPTSYGPLKASQIDAALATSQTMVGWAGVDAMARLLTGQPAANLDSVAVQALYPKDVTWDPNKSDWPGPPGWQQNYEKLWGIG